MQKLSSQARQRLHILKLIHGYFRLHRNKLRTQRNRYKLTKIVLVFRGTLPWDIKNWVSDINFVVTNYPLCDNSTIYLIQECKVHRGFYYAFVDIQKQIMAKVG